MGSVVLDASAVLAMMQDEPGGERVLALFDEGAATIVISAVNLCEVVTKLMRDGVSEADAREAVQPMLGLVEDFSLSQALRTGELYRMTSASGLSLGDRACLALAEEKKATAWTADRAWRALKIGIPIELIRS